MAENQPSPKLLGCANDENIGLPRCHSTPMGKDGGNNEVYRPKFRRVAKSHRSFPTLAPPDEIIPSRKQRVQNSTQYNKCIHITPSDSKCNHSQDPKNCNESSETRRKCGVYYGRSWKSMFLNSTGNGSSERRERIQSRRTLTTFHAILHLREMSPQTNERRRTRLTSFRISRIRHRTLAHAET